MEQEDGSNKWPFLIFSWGFAVDVDSVDNVLDVLYRKQGGPQNQSGPCEQEKNLFPLPETKLWFLGHLTHSLVLYHLSYPAVT